MRAVQRPEEGAGNLALAPVNRLAEALNVPPCRLLTLNAARDYYTSSLAYAFQKMRCEGLSSAGKPALLIEVAAGLQVWCALYYA